ncbi:cytochrome c [Siccirubricoccus sp. KC 17139]|uniref:Cytochrome c n=1 Tax=Siccirubricoccus soli TaxID=2899147 RepID=A0ABT1D8N7_9PROT|nr:cytochrome c [Siccirubricoccus soli]MCO6417962.1 cytochrome c [Siccirubricoccus soli]MCP2684097.1 cytochrome c [Siccirubricoccus soli]
MRAALLLLPLVLTACKQEMAQQRKLGTHAAAPFWPDGTSARPLPVGVVARGALEHDRALAEPPPVTPALLQRGQERYGIYCAPCHGLVGDGDGMIPRRGFPRPPSYHTPRLRAAPASHFLEVITHGYGVMYGYAARVEPADRWAIIAYIRALQLSQGAELAAVPEAREKLP